MRSLLVARRCLAVDLTAIKTLRAQTKAGVMACRNALEQADGNMDKAKELLLSTQVPGHGRRPGQL